MKSQVEPGSVNGSSSAGGVRMGKVQKRRNKTRDQQRKVVAERVGVEEVEVDERGEVKAYLDKLQEIVPFMPKDKKLSKLEVITHAIDYIRDLSFTLGLPLCENEEYDDDFDISPSSPDASSTEAEDISYASDIPTSGITYSNEAVETALSLSVTTSAPAPSPNENYSEQEQQYLHSSNHSGNGNVSRQPFCAISNRNGTAADSNSSSLEESLKLKQISCRF